MTVSETQLRNRLREMESRVSTATNMLGNEVRRTRAYMGGLPHGFPETPEEMLNALAQDLTTDIQRVVGQLNEILLRAYEGLGSIPITPETPSEDGGEIPDYGRPPRKKTRKGRRNY